MNVESYDECICMRDHIITDISDLGQFYTWLMVEPLKIMRFRSWDHPHSHMVQHKNDAILRCYKWESRSSH